jgi:hypothetical protein
VAAKDIPEGAEILIHHNATHDTYKLFNYLRPTAEASSDIQYFSIPIEECFLWRDGQDKAWQPLNNFVTGLRIFEPYTGFLEGIPSTLIKNKIYVTSGDLIGKVVTTLISSDYEIIYQNDDGTEGKIIRLRYYPEGHERNEVIAIDHNLTSRVINNEVLIGYGISDASRLVITTPDVICLN